MGFQIKFNPSIVAPKCVILPARYKVPAPLLLPRLEERRGEERRGDSVLRMETRNPLRT
jgi:hypothetical protein